MSLLAIGQCVYDITLPIEEGLVENQKYRIHQKSECIGGPATNAAYLCGLWGLDTTLVARVGSDHFGKLIKETLETVDINTQFLSMDTSLKTSLSIVIVNTINGSRTILNQPLPKLEKPLKLPESKPDLILVDGRELETSLKAIELYPQAVSVIDAGTYKETLKPLLEKVDYLVCSKDFAKQFTRIDIDINQTETLAKTFEALKQLNQNNLIVTLGENGVIALIDNEIMHLNAYPAEVVDTTGAGDLFHGAFVYGLHRKLSLIDTLKLANLTASISTERFGGQTSIPSFAEVKERASLIAPDLLKYL